MRSQSAVSGWRSAARVASRIRVRWYSDSRPSGLHSYPTALAMSACSAVGPMSAPTRGEAFAISAQFWMPSIVSIGMMYSIPATPVRASKWSTRVSYRMTSVAEFTFGANRPDRPSATDASRSLPVNRVASEFGRTKSPSFGWDLENRSTAAATSSRAAGLRSAGTESSRSKQTASAPESTALSYHDVLCAGTNSTVR